ncbi:MAG TPA: hypothetical protein VH496_16350 [Mycobacterium sp.]|jgi:hypothetical protein
MAILPEDRQNAKDALAYLTTVGDGRLPGDPTGAEFLEQLEDGGTSTENLLSGMVTLVSMLVAIRHRDDNVTPANTLQELGQKLAEGE